MTDCCLPSSFTWCTCHMPSPLPYYPRHTHPIVVLNYFQFSKLICQCHLQALLPAKVLNTFTYLVTPYILQILASLLIFLKNLSLFPILPPHLTIEKALFLMYMEQPVLASILALVLHHCTYLLCYLFSQFINLREDHVFCTPEVSMHDTDNW